MNDIIIIYTIKFNVGPYKGKTEIIEIELEELETSGLDESLWDNGYIYYDQISGDPGFEVLERTVK